MREPSKRLWRLACDHVQRGPADDFEKQNPKTTSFVAGYRAAMLDSMRIAVVFLLFVLVLFLLTGCVTATYRFGCGVSSTSVGMPHARAREVGRVNQCKREGRGK